HRFMLVRKVRGFAGWVLRFNERFQAAVEAQTITPYQLAPDGLLDRSQMDRFVDPIHVCKRTVAARTADVTWHNGKRRVLQFLSYDLPEISFSRDIYCYPTHTIYTLLDRK